jgi:hypothetical protein
MRTIQVNEHTSAQSLREQLGEFDTFSAVDAKNENGVVVLYEVKLGERIKRFFNRPDIYRLSPEEESRRALGALAEKRPEIAKVLGRSIAMNFDGWTTSDLRKALKAPSTPLTSGENGRALEIKDLKPGQVGVARSASSMIKADYRIIWKNAKEHANTPTNEAGEIDHQVNAKIVAMPDGGLSKEVLDKAYRDALHGTTGHVVIVPIADKPASDKASAKNGGDVEGHYSEDNLNSLLEAIDDAMQKNSGISVTIAVGSDKKLSQRLAAAQARRQVEKNKNGEWQRVPIPVSQSRFVTERTQQRIKSLDEKNLDMQKTSLKNVSICHAEPGRLKADVTFLADSLRDLSEKMARDGYIELNQAVKHSYHSAYISNETKSILNKSREKWTVCAIEVPPCELPTSRLLFRLFGGNSPTREQSKAFFLAHLEGLSGRVVIEPREDPHENQGLWDAVKEISSRPENKCNFVFASRNAELIVEFKETINSA